MQRRKFLKTAGVGAAAATTVAAPALAQGLPELKWRLTSSFPKSLDTLFGGAELFCRRVGELTDGKFKITPFASGEIVPGFQVLDAVQNGTVEIGQTAAYYYIGKDITFTFDTAVPFGLNSRQHVAWWMHGGGREAMAEFYKDYGVVGHLMGGTGAQMGGWFRKEIKTVDDLKGLKFRVGGFAGQILGKLGVVAQQIPGGEIYPALEKGTIDAAEWVGPYDDEKLGFHKVAPYYYYPGWWEGTGMGTAYINQKSWDALPPSLPEGDRDHGQRGHAVDAGQVRQRQPGRAAAPGGGRRQAATLPDGGARSLLQCDQRGLQRNRGQERQVQEGVGQLEALPLRAGPVVAHRGRRFRRLHGTDVWCR